MLVWMVGWLELAIVDGVVLISMDPRVTLGYMAWQKTMHLGPLGLDELNHEGDGGESSSSSEEDQMNVDNPIHDDP